MIKKSILLVDDDADFVRVLSARCQSIGFDVVCAHNLLSATLLAAKRAPDIACLDVQMPTGNGLQFAESLAADPATALVPVVVLTGESSLETQHSCERLQAHYVAKSVNYWSTLEPLLRQLAAETPPRNELKENGTRTRNRRANSLPALPITLMVESAGAPKAKQIVVADDDEDVLRLLSQRFSTLNCSVFGVNNALDAINVIHRIMPDLVCLDVGMPSGNGLSICEMMAADEQLRKTPVIILTGRSDESTIRRCHDMLVYYVQKSADTWSRIEPLARELLQLDELPKVASPKPPAPSPTAAESPAAPRNDCRDALLDAVFAALGADEPQEKCGSGDHDETQVLAEKSQDIPWVLSIDDDAEFSDALRIRLEQHGVAVRRAFNGMEGFRLAFTSPASAILLDFNMPNGQGDYILGRLKDNPVTANIPVIIITGMRDKVLERRMLAMGASAFLEKPVCFERLRAELARHIDILEINDESPRSPRQEVFSR